ncbi:unnamed protein product [Musa acuminata subsp. burmannicoides]
MTAVRQNCNSASIIIFGEAILSLVHYRHYIVRAVKGCDTTIMKCFWPWLKVSIYLSTAIDRLSILMLLGHRK